MAIDESWWQDPDLPLPEAGSMDLDHTLEYILKLRGDFKEQLAFFIRILDASRWEKKRLTVLTYIDVSLMFAVNAEVREALEFVLMSMKDEVFDQELVERTVSISSQKDATPNDDTKCLDPHQIMRERMDRSSLFNPQKNPQKKDQHNE
jgi:hypothetical protein